jgi:hypothetical protein
MIFRGSFRPPQFFARTALSVPAEFKNFRQSEHKQFSKRPRKSLKTSVLTSTSKHQQSLTFAPHGNAFPHDAQIKFSKTFSEIFPLDLTVIRYKNSTEFR